MTSRVRGGVLVWLVLASSPAYAHGDMGAKGLFELIGLGMSILLLPVSVVLGLVSRWMTKKVRTPGAVFWAGLVGVLAVTAFTLAGAGAAISSEMFVAQTPMAFAALLVVVPALFAAQFFFSARLYGRLGAHGLRLGSGGLGVVFALLAGFAGLALLVEEVIPKSSEVPTSGEVRAYRTDCEHDDGSACNMLGLRLRAGSGVKKDAQAAAQAFEKACTIGASIGCRNLAELLTSGEVPRDEAAAHRWLERYAELEKKAQ